MPRRILDSPTCTSESDFLTTQLSISERTLMRLAEGVKAPASACQIRRHRHGPTTLRSTADQTLHPRPASPLSAATAHRSDLQVWRCELYDGRMSARF